jgi:hypothetical protein
MGGRVVREYVGTGLIAELAAEQAARDRRRRAELVAAQHAERTVIEAADAALAEFCTATEALARASLLLAGYHRHARGAWRRRR